MLRSQLHNPTGAAIACRSACESILRNHFRDQSATLADLSARVKDRKLAEAIEAIRCAGNTALHGVSTPASDNMLLLQSHLAVVINKCGQPPPGRLKG